MAGIIAITLICLVFGVGALAVLTEHLQNMAKIQAQSPRHDQSEILAVVEELRREIADLRDTSTHYDMSFDAALQRMESRVAHLERRSSAAPHAEPDDQYQRAGSGASR